MIRKLYVNNLDWNIRGKDLKEIFSNYGKVFYSRVNLDNNNRNRSKGFGFVIMDNSEKAILHLNGKEILGRPININFAIDKFSIDYDSIYCQTIINSPNSIVYDEYIPNCFKENNDIVLLTNSFSLEFIKNLLISKDELYKLTPHKFEEFIAFILSELGYSCELTSKTRDGGKDIIVTKKDIFIQRFYVECKLYKPDKLIGISIIKQLHSTVLNDKVTKGILATTSYFTKPANNFIKQNEWILEGKDFNGIFSWIDLYASKKVL